MVQIDDIQRRHRNGICLRRCSKGIHDVGVPVIGAARQRIRSGADIENGDIREMRYIHAFRSADRAAERIGRPRFRAQHKAGDA